MKPHFIKFLTEFMTLWTEAAAVVVMFYLPQVFGFIPSWRSAGRKAHVSWQTCMFIYEELLFLETSQWSLGGLQRS